MAPMARILLREQPAWGRMRARRDDAKLAAQRAMGIASGVPFILPVVIDDTREPDALVPDRFRAVQWTHRMPTRAP